MEYSIFHPENVNIRNRPKSMIAHAEVEFGLSRFQFHALLRSGEPLISYISWYITFNLARLIPSHWHSSRSSDHWSTCTKHFSLHLSVLSSSPSGTQPLSKYVNNESFKKCFNALFSSDLMQGSYFAVSNDFSKTNMTKRPVWRDTIFNRNQRILGICNGSLRCPPEYVLLYREFGGNLWERDSQNRLATEVFFMKKKTQGNLCKHLIDWFHGTMVW